MTCPNCGTAPDKDSQLFCEVCGKPLPVEGHAATAPSVPHAERLAKDNVVPCDGSVKVCDCEPGESSPDEDGYCLNCGVKCGIKKSAGTVVIEEGASNPHRIEIAPDEKLALVSDIGLRHTNNEDCGIVARNTRGDAVLVVADGVSTSYHPAGASAAAAKIISEALAGIDEQVCAEDVMRNAIQAAHDAIITQPSGDNPDLDGPLTTIVAAFVQDKKVTIGWVGDSRAYVVNESDEVQRTVDDSWMEQVIASGEFTREEAGKNRLAHAVTQVLGVRDEGDEIEIHVLTAEIAAGDILLLCTDGLWNYYEEPGTLSDDIRAFGMKRPAIEISSHLVAMANSLGGNDNITVAVMSVGEVAA